MIQQLAKDPYQNRSVQARKHIEQTLTYFHGKLQPGMKILDVGGRSPLTDAFEEIFHVKIDNTQGDLDLFFEAQQKNYNVVIYSHTLEHQFNPLHTLHMLRLLYTDHNTVIYIMVPRRGKLLWDKGHFHEIDHYRMQLLIKRAGFKIIDYRLKKHWRAWYSYLKGVRMFLRLFFEYDAYYVVRKV